LVKWFSLFIPTMLFIILYIIISLASFLLVWRLCSLGFLHRNLHIKSRKIKEQAYKSLVRPQLEYATTVWDPYHKN
jgi:hypothetical protein